jgi:hypothetical protein
MPGGARRANMLRLLQAEWIVDLTTRADREGKHAEYANRYDRSELKQANLKELNMQIDRGYRVRAWRAPRLDAPPLHMAGGARGAERGPARGGAGLGRAAQGAGGADGDHQPLVLGHPHARQGAARRPAPLASSMRPPRTRLRGPARRRCRGPLPAGQA